MRDPERLHQIFTKVGGDLPQIAANTRPLGIGNFGIVLENADNTITKLAFRIENPNDHPDPLLMFKQEIAVLRHLRDHPIGDLETPVMIGEPLLMDHPDYLGAFTMTKLSGGACFLPGQMQTYRPQAYSAGRLLAKFHRAMRGHVFPETLGYGKEMGAHIVHVPTLSDQTNAALTIVDAYLQANKRPGIIHGDFHVGNILSDGENVTSLLDFSHTGRASNILTDMILMPNNHLDSLIAGYERESGEKIRELAIATQLSYCTIAINKISADEPAKQLPGIIEINTHLNNLTYITGFKP